MKITQKRKTFRHFNFPPRKSFRENYTYNDLNDVFPESVECMVKSDDSNPIDLLILITFLSNDFLFENINNNNNNTTVYKYKIFL
mgnify:CR=1 FL=1